MTRNLVHTSNTTCCKVHALGCIQVGPLRLIRLHRKKKTLKSRPGLPGYQRVKARIRQNWTVVKFERKCHQASEERWLECHTKVGERTGTRRGKLSLTLFFRARAKACDCGFKSLEGPDVEHGPLMYDMT